MDFNSSGSLEMRYLNGPTGDLVDTVLARESASGTVAWYLPDKLGTTRDLLGSTGSIIDHVDYSAFGTVLDESSPSNGDRMMGFAGTERDMVTGLNLAVNRVQNPGTGRWTSQDPLGFESGDSDPYTYAWNAPENYADPTGLAPTAGGPTCIPPKAKFPDGWWYKNPVVEKAIGNAWSGSNPNGRFDHEEGGWIYYNPTTRIFRVVPFPLPPGPQPVPRKGRKPQPRYHMDPPPPAPGPGECTVGFFHTHNDNNAYQSGRDRHFANTHNVPSRVVTGPGPNQGSTYVPPRYPNRLD